MPESSDIRVEVLARTVWGEARGEGEAGMEAVIATVLNRLALAPRYGLTIPGVCLKPWQYSCWNADDPNRRKLGALLEDDTAFARARVLAHRAIEEHPDDPTGGATHYYAVSLPPPAWTKRQADGRQAEATVRIGRHLFFKNVP